MWLPLMRPLLGIWPATQACALAGNQTADPLVCRRALNPLSHTSQGTSSYFSLSDKYVVIAHCGLICFYLMANDVDDLHTCLFPICISSLVDPSCFVNKVLLEHNHTHSFMYHLCLLLHCNSRTEHCNRHCMATSPKYLLPCPSQRHSAHPCCRRMMTYVLRLGTKLSQQSPGFLGKEEGTNDVSAALEKASWWWSEMPIAALFEITQIQKQQKHPPRGQCVNKAWYMFTLEYCSNVQPFSSHGTRRRMTKILQQPPKIIFADLMKNRCNFDSFSKKIFLTNYLPFLL